MVEEKDAKNVLCSVGARDSIVLHLINILTRLYREVATYHGNLHRQLHGGNLHTQLIMNTFFLEGFL